MARLRNIVFDFHDVLMDKDIWRTIREFERLMDGKADAILAGEAFPRLLFQFETGAIDEAAFVAGLQELSPRQVDGAAIVAGWNAMLRDIPPGRVELLRELKGRYDLYLLSNSNPLHHRRAAEHLRAAHGIAEFDAEFFRATYYSYRIGKVKPDRAVFERLLAEQGLVPDETLFIDDNAENVAVARGLGIHAVFHDPGKDIAETVRAYLERPGVALTGRLDEHQVHDVIIVGAGLSGLAAADSLREQGVRYLVVEAADRPGGRVLTAGGTDRGFYDLGGGFVGGTQYFIEKYIDKYELGTINTYLDTTKSWIYQRPDGSTLRMPGDNPLALPGGDETVRTLALWNAFSLNVRANLDDPGRTINAELLDSITAEDWLVEFQRRHRLNQDTVDLARLSINCLLSTEPSRVSMLFVQYYAATAGDYAEIINVNGGPDSDNNSWSPEGRRLTYGAGDLVRRLLHDVGPEHVHYGCAVEEIREVDGVARLVVHDRSAGRRAVLRARHVIVAMSPVMARRISCPDFAGSPAGDERLKLTERMFMGRTNKGFLAYKRPFWRHKGLMGYTLSAGRYEQFPLSWTLDHSWEPRPPTNRQTPMVARPYALMTFLIGDAAAYWADRGFEARREAIIRQLVGIYGEEARTELIDGEAYVEKDWHDDPFTQGGPSALMPPGILAKYGAALRRPVGRVHWAGAETATNWCGYMDGAIQAGYRAATEVARALGKAQDIYFSRGVL